MEDRNHDEIVSEQNKKLRMQRNYYRRLHVDDLCILNAEEYYENLKDWSKFKEPRDMSKRNAEKDSKITFCLKCKSIFSDKAKKELEEKRKEAKILQQKYEQRHQKRVDRKLAQFKEYQRKNHESVDKMKSLYARGDKKQIINYYNAVLANDDFTLDILYRQERYDSASMISEYDEKTKTLSYRYRIPSSDEICVIDRFVYDGESGEVVAKELDKTHAKRVRMHLLQTLLLRSVARIICSDESKNIEFINLTGFLRYYDRAYGNNREINVVKLKIGRDILLQINPERANISELFERTLKGKFKTSAGLYDKEPFCLTEIK
ncbi:hypothetical protein [Thomasclavelia spiroformis]|uniref:hypothetical protein n=1 Tax=Thomasclavelia spiroformis TaxID=29348 RepID=UPI00399AC275